MRKEHFMGEAIIIRAISVIQGGLLQIDFFNEETKENYRCFSEPSEFFSMLGKAMQINVDKWNNDFHEKQSA